MKKLESCDTFVALKDVTASGKVIFGKNSDRPYGEVQEVVHVAAQKHQKGSKLKCTYIEIPQAEVTYETILSKPAWLWGAEMGANSFGVAIGNEAVWNRLSDPEYDAVPRLLGMDLLRLGLERGSTAQEALEVITDLLEQFGQGGPCSDIVPEHVYHNSFLIADANEAWILETARTFWVAQRVTSGIRNISNCMSITTQIDKMSKDLLESAKNQGWWNGTDPFNWIEVIGEANQLPSSKLTTPNERYCAGKKLLENHSDKRDFQPQLMMDILRDTRSNICRHYYSEKRTGNPTTGSMVSLLASDESSCIHFLTATPDPSVSIYKPFRFGIGDNLDATTSPCSFPMQAQGTNDRAHSLWKLHGEVNRSKNFDYVYEKLAKLENEWMKDDTPTKEFIYFADAVKMETRIYLKLLQLTEEKKSNLSQ